MSLRTLLKDCYRRLPWSVLKAINAGSGRYCPVCEAEVKRFLPFGGAYARQDAMCPVCFSLERHRFAWLFFKRHTDLFDGRAKRFLHFAPETAFERQFRLVPGVDYLTADLYKKKVMAKVDIEAMPFADGSFDVCYHAHVLEAVDDDRKAMAELFRVLKPGGWMLCLVRTSPQDETYEDPSVTDPQQMLKLFGQTDYRRRYGRDFSARLEAAGFSVTSHLAGSFAEIDSRRMSIPAEEELFFCTKG